jgi:Tfp pilus assembly protein PilN
MSSARTQQGFPAVPSTLNPSDHEMHEPYNIERDEDFVPNTAPYYTPYLGLRARLSQTWINKWTILLLLVLCRVLLAVRGLNSDIASAKAQALSACTSVENVGSAMASMPHYLSQGVNALAADGVTKAVNGLMDMLTLTVTGVEEIILFVINMMTSTYVCLITLVIGGSLHVAINMIEEVGAFMNKTISGLTGEISSDLNTFQTDFNSFLSAISDVAGFFGGSKTPPTINITSQINELNSITIDPTTMDADLTKLNASIPNFAQVQNFTNNIISLPFEEIKKLINESLPAYTFDQSVFPVAQKQALTFCSDNDSINTFFDGLVDTANLAKKIFIAVLIALAVLVCIPMAYRQLWQWRTMQQRSMLLQKNAFDPMDVIYIASRPYTSTAGIKAASKFKSTKRQILIRWAIAYATTVPALLVLALGLAGLLSCLCQYILLRVIQKEAPVLANEVGDFAGTVVSALNNASEAWAVDANSVISGMNTKINADVFGWVNTSTTAVNSTLNAFVDQTMQVLNDTFGGTILYDPIVGTLNCLVFLKVAGIEKGLTWVKDNAHVTFPEFRNDTFSLGAAASIANSSDAETFLSSPGSATSDDITGAVTDLIDVMQGALLEEVYIACGLILIWLIIVFIGLIRAIIGMAGRDKTRAEGGPVGYTGDKRASLSPRSPNRNEDKFPTFGAPVSSVYPQRSHEDMAMAAGGLSSNNEKIGHAGMRSVGDAVKTPAPGHIRGSSYGYVADGDNKI